MWSLAVAAILCSHGVATSVVVPTKIMNDGHKIPILALGTYGSDIGKMRPTINWAVEAGYRHIDTASLYGNENEIGLGIRDVIIRRLVTREDLFVTSKLGGESHARDKVVTALRQSLVQLTLFYVDLYLIDFPSAINADGSPSNIDYVETWAGMEEALRLGLTKSIGVSNFDINQIERLIANSTVIPAVNQIEVHPTHTNHPIADHCLNLGIEVMGYSPFGFLVPRGATDAPPPHADDPTLVAIARKYGKTTAQVVLRYQIDRQIIPIPKSTNKKHLEQNINVFDFKLTPNEIRIIDSFNRNRSVE